MPTPAQVEAEIDPVTGPLGFVRLLGDREAIEKVTTTWDKVVVDRSADLAETAGVIRVDGRAGAGRRLRQQPLRRPLPGDRPTTPRPARPARAGPARAAAHDPVRLNRGHRDAPGHRTRETLLDAAWSVRRKTWARKLGRLRLGAEPSRIQLARYRRVTWA